MAIGAAREDIGRVILREGMPPVPVGLAAGGMAVARHHQRVGTRRQSVA